MKRAFYITAAVLIGFFAWRAISIAMSRSTDAMQVFFVQSVVFAAALGPVYLGIRWLQRKPKVPK